MNYQSIIIEESLENKEALKDVKVLTTEVEQVTKNHKTPWLKQWTMHTVEIPEYQVNTTAIDISKSIDTSHKDSWYADFKNDQFHCIIFKNKVFKVDRSNKQDYDQVVQYGLLLGIPKQPAQFFARYQGRGAIGRENSYDRLRRLLH